VSVASAFLGATLVASAAGKLKSREALSPYLAQFGVPRGTAVRLGLLVSMGELALGVLLLAAGQRWVYVAAAVVTLGFLAVHAMGMLGGRGASCRCFGAIDTDLDPVLGLVRAAVLAVVALALALPSGHGPAASPGATTVYALASGILTAFTYVLSFPLIDESLKMFRRDRESHAALLAIRKAHDHVL
jgi:hypothetical protein